MNFGEIIKKELVNKPIKEIHCKKAFLAGLIRGSGVIVERESGICLEFKVCDEETAIIVNSYLKSIFNYELREISVSNDRLNHKDRFDISLPTDIAIKVLLEFGILVENANGYDVSFDFYKNLGGKDCCLHSFLKGLFISSGSCTVPSDKDSNTKYHLELVFNHSVPAQMTQGILIKNGISPKILIRKDKYVLYLKSGEEIKDFIAFLPAPVAVLRLTDIMIEREIVNNTNRAKNCDIGNVNRQVEASSKQIEAIEKIIKIKGLNFLKEDLKQTAITRKNYPFETMVELAKRLNITKSCLNNRLRKIISISKEIQE